jgi:hypothetical protein
MDNPMWQVSFGAGPLVAAALHDGDEVRAELQPWLSISPEARLREEDPFTSLWTSMAPTRIVGLRSRFEVDLNRPRDKAVYLTPEDSWGLTVWKQPLPHEFVNRSLTMHDAFYEQVHHWLTQLVRWHGRIVVFDLHSYNHRREGAAAPPARLEENPEVNIGTGTMDRGRWGVIVDRFMDELRRFDYRGRRLDVRENVKFRGGYFPRWIHESFPESVCAIAVELKKFFMDEWRGQAEPEELCLIGQALAAAANGVWDELEADAGRAQFLELRGGRCQRRSVNGANDPF